MMNKLIAGGLMLAGILTGCAPDKTAEEEPVPVARGKAAVVYFSWSPAGNTRFAAETIADKLGAGVFEIKAQTPYSDDFRKCCDEAVPECRDKLPRPIQPIDGLDLSRYDAVFIGTPNWCGTLAPPVRTFIIENAAALRGKTVCLFLTHGSGGMQQCGEDFAELFPDSRVLPAQAFPGSSIRQSVPELEKFVTDRVVVK